MVVVDLVAVAGLAPWGQKVKEGQRERKNKLRRKFGLGGKRNISTPTTVANIENARDHSS